MDIDMSGIEKAAKAILAQIREDLYDKGNWQDAETSIIELERIMENIRRNANVIYSWNLYAEQYKSDKKEEDKVRTCIFVGQINEMLPEIKSLSVRFTIILNSLGITLADMGQLDKAENILKEAMEKNAILSN